MDLPVRKKIRLDGIDYSSCGTYFVTVCITQRYTLLWEDRACGLGEPTLSETGVIIEADIQQIPSHYDQIENDQYCIMPDHVHLIVIIHPNEPIPSSGDSFAQETAKDTLLKVIGSMKRWVTKQLGYSIWQKSFYERVIRNKSELAEVRQYIQDNPKNHVKRTLDLDQMNSADTGTTTATNAHDIE